MPAGAGHAGSSSSYEPAQLQGTASRLDSSHGARQELQQVKRQKRGPAQVLLQPAAMDNGMNDIAGAARVAARQWALCHQQEGCAVQASVSGQLLQQPDSSLAGQQGGGVEHQPDDGDDDDDGKEDGCDGFDRGSRGGLQPCHMLYWLMRGGVSEQMGYDASKWTRR